MHSHDALTSRAQPPASGVSEDTGRCAASATRIATPRCRASRRRSRVDPMSLRPRHRRMIMVIMEAHSDVQAPQDLVDYVSAEPANVSALRNRPQGAFPWPSPDNPMLGHLIGQARDMDDRQAAIIWVAVHAWFEGALAATSRGVTDDAPAVPVSRETVLQIALQLDVSESTARRYADGVENEARKRRRDWIEGDPSTDE